MSIQKQRIFRQVVLMAVVMLCSFAIMPQMVGAEGDPTVAKPIGETANITNDLTQHNFQITSGGTYEFSGNNPNATITVTTEANNNVIIRLNSATLDCITINRGLTFLETVDTEESSVKKIIIKKSTNVTIADNDFPMSDTDVENRAGNLYLTGANIALNSINNIDSAALMIGGEESADVSNVTLQSLDNNGYVTNNGNLTISNSGSNGVRIYNKGSMKINGAFNNSDVIENFSGATLEIEGTLTNSSNIINNGTFTNNGIFTNNGTFENTTGIFTEHGTTINHGTWSGDGEPYVIAKTDGELNDLSEHNYTIVTGDYYKFTGGDARNHSIKIQGNVSPTLNLAEISNMGEIVVGKNVNVHINSSDSGTIITGHVGEPGVKLGDRAEFILSTGMLTVNGGGDTEINAITNHEGVSTPVCDIAGWHNNSPTEWGKVVASNGAKLNALVLHDIPKTANCQLYGERTLSGQLDQALHITPGAELTIRSDGSYIAGGKNGMVDGTVLNNGKIEIYDCTVNVSETGSITNKGVIQNEIGVTGNYAECMPGCLLVEGCLTNEHDGTIRNNGGKITVSADGNITNDGTIYAEGGTIERTAPECHENIDLIPKLGGTIFLYSLGSGEYSIVPGSPSELNLTNISIGSHVSEIFKIEKVNSNIVVPNNSYSVKYTVQSIKTIQEVGTGSVVLNVKVTGKNHAYGNLSEEVTVPITLEPVPSGKIITLIKNMPYYLSENSENCSGWIISGERSDDGTPVTDSCVYSSGITFYVSENADLTFTEVTK